MNEILNIRLAKSQLPPADKMLKAIRSAKLKSGVWPQIVKYANAIWFDALV